MWKITPLDVGELEYDVSESTFRRGMGKKANEKFVCWYLTDGTNKVLVDCGLPDIERSKKWHPYTNPRVSEDQQLPNILKKMGIKCEEINLIVLTHLHWDHASGMPHFPNAQIRVSQTELQYAIDAEPMHYAGYEAPQLGITPAFLTEIARIKTVKMKEQQILPGLTMFPTPGHTVGSMSVLVETTDGPYVITGDAVACYDNLKGDPKKGIKYLATGIFVDMMAMLDSMALIDEKANYKLDHILPGHDSKVFEHACYPVENK